MILELSCRSVDTAERILESRGVKWTSKVELDGVVVWCDARSIVATLENAGSKFDIAGDETPWRISQ